MIIPYLRFCSCGGCVAVNQKDPRKLPSFNPWHLHKDQDEKCMQLLNFFFLKGLNLILQKKNEITEQ